MNLFNSFLYLPIIYLLSFFTGWSRNSKERYFILGFCLAYYFATFLVKLLILKLRLTNSKPGLGIRLFLVNLSQVGFFWLAAFLGNLFQHKGLVISWFAPLGFLAAVLIQIWTEAFFLKGFFDSEFLPKLRSALSQAFVLNYLVVNLIFIAATWFLGIMFFGFDIL